MCTVGIREQLTLTQEEFALLVGADVCSVQRWEAGDGQPEGAAKQVIAAILAILQKPTGKIADLKERLLFYAQFGGLAFLIFDLLDRSIDSDKAKVN